MAGCWGMIEADEDWNGNGMERLRRDEMNEPDANVGDRIEEAREIKKHAMVCKCKDE